MVPQLKIVSNTRDVILDWPSQETETHPSSFSVFFRQVFVAFRLGPISRWLTVKKKFRRHRSRLLSRPILRGSTVGGGGVYREGGMVVSRIWEMTGR